MDLERQTAWLNRTKNGTPRGVPLNRDAVAVLAGERGKHAVYCFSYRGQPSRWELTNSAWHTAIAMAAITDFRHQLPRVEDLGAWKSRVMVDRYAKFGTEHLTVAAARIERGCDKNVVDLVRFRHTRNDKGLAV